MSQVICDNADKCEFGCEHRFAHDKSLSCKGNECFRFDYPVKCVEIKPKKAKKKG